MPMVVAPFLAGRKAGLSGHSLAGNSGKGLPIGAHMKQRCV
jgi:hypothetical protein